MTKCPFCGREGYVRSVFEEDYLKHSVMLASVEGRLNRLEKQMEAKP